jgi:hypothetical protein
MPTWRRIRMRAAGVWQQVHPSEAAQWLSGLGNPWWIAGGWAIDLFLGRQSRSHKDLDIGILRRDALRVTSALAGYEFFEVKDGILTPLNPRTPPQADVNSLWARPASSAPWALQILLDDARGESWIFRREPRIELPLSIAIRRHSNHIPYLAPEVQLLYKARAVREQDQADFNIAAPRLAAGARAWLRASLEISDPKHPWLESLAALQA